MVLGLAMCTTFAFAQTSMKPRDLEKLRAEKPVMSELKAEPVDYKASIFTKDATFDTVRCFRFNATDMAEITYGFIASSDHINVDGRDSTFGSDAHSVNVNTNDWAQWRHYADSADLCNNIFDDYSSWVGNFYCGDGNGGSDFAWVFNRIGTVINRSDAGWQDDGLMFIGLDGPTGSTPGVGNVNTYFELPVVNRTITGAHMVYIGVTQAYYKFYDECFIDYKIGNTWYAREINVLNIDVNINSGCTPKVRYVMPINIASESAIKLRVRMSAKKYAAYGYGWFLDNLAVITDNRTESWDFNTSTPLDGFYGMIPQNMTIPMSYGVHVRNTNASDLTNTKLVVSNAPANGTWSVAATGTPATIPAGDVLKDYKLYINERGFMCTTHRDDTLFNWGAHSLLGHFENYGNQGPLTGGYLGRGLNTSTVGPNFYAIKAEGGQNLVQEFDTVLYTVSDYLEFDEVTEPNRVSGYRWARDNGLIPSNSSFQVGFTADHYLDADDDADHAMMQGYRVYVRYVTGSDVPEGYVFRGLEYVPSTELTPSAMVTQSSVLLPIVYEEVPGEDGDLEWEDLPCGIDNTLFPITEDAVNNLPTTYALPGSEANYSALNVKFLDEPVLKKNTAYLFGYMLYDEATFMVAQQQWGYTDGNNVVRYTANEATAPYYSQNTPVMPYDVIVYDANGSNSGGSHWITGWNINNFPMIRPIVGTPSPVQRVSVAGDCSSNVNDTLGFTVQYSTSNLCETSADVAVGSNQSFYVLPLGDHSVIQHVYVNGVEAPIYDEDDDAPETNFWLYEHDRNVIDPLDSDNVILYRHYYTLFFQGIENNDNGYTITADVEWHAWDLSGIDPVAPEAFLSLAPNPATSSVKLNIAGVSGMVNCSIIDMSGRVVYNANVNAEAETNINVSSLPAGAYFVRVTNNTFSKIEKLIIK